MENEKQNRGYKRDFDEEESSQLIVEFSKNCLEDIIYTLHKKLEEEGFRVIKYGKRLYLKCDEKRMLLEAEAMQLKKILNFDKKWRHFSIVDFLNENSTYEEATALLSDSEKVRVCQHILEENIRITKKVIIPTVGEVSPGQSFVAVLQKHKLIASIYPLHDYRVLRHLKHIWINSYATLGAIPLPKHQIKEYFGERVAYYFCFLDYFTRCLIPIVMLSALFHITGFPFEFFGIITNVYFFLYLKIWKVISNDLSLKWGTFLEQNGKQHYLYVKNDRSCELRYTNPDMTAADYQYTRQQLVISWSAIFLFLFIVCTANVAFIELQTMYPSVTTTVAYSVCLYYICILYQDAVSHRTEVENHSNEQNYEWHLVCKLIALNCATLFFCPLYILFILEDNNQIENVLFTQFTVTQILDTLTELIIPLITNEWLKVKQSIVEANKDDESPKLLLESMKISYNSYSLYIDYLHLYIRFGYISLFSGVYPKAAMFAIIHNIAFESFIDAFKLCNINQRPLIRSAKGIGVWEKAFRVLCMLSLAVNTLFMDTYQFVEFLNLTERQWRTLLVFVTSMAVTVIELIPEYSEQLLLALRTNTETQTTILEMYARTKLKEGFHILHKLKPCSSEDFEQQKTIGSRFSRTQFSI